jgi:hypothetical protein
MAILSKIHSLGKSIHALDSAIQKGLFNDDYEYQYEKNELVSQLNSFSWYHLDAYSVELAHEGYLLYQSVFRMS